MLTDSQKAALRQKLINLGNAREYHAAYMAYWKRNRRKAARTYLENKQGHKGCANCGSTKHLEFDHINRADKTVKSNHLWTMAEVLFWAEIDKCQLLCRKCHRIKTNKEESELAAQTEQAFDVSLV